MITDLARTVRTSREALFKGLAEGSRTAKYLTRIENDCFGTCLAIIDEVLPELPEHGYK
jgi:hypothetical protein